MISGFRFKNKGEINIVDWLDPTYFGKSTISFLVKQNLLIGKTNQENYCKFVETGGWWFGTAASKT